MNIIKYIFIISTSLLLVSCNYFTLLNNKEWIKKSDNEEIEVYISGYRNYYDNTTASDFSDDIAIACYWKLGKNNPIDLEQGNPGEAFDLAIYNDDVYICGLYNGTFYKGTEKACYWKNGNIVTLDCPTSVSSAVSITIIDNDIYICGYYWYISSLKACYWKNGVFHSLHEDYNSIAYDIFVSKNELGQENIYVSGRYNDGVDNHACYWKNSNFNSLPDHGLGDSIAYGIRAAGNDLIIGGYSDNDPAAPPATQYRVCYWKNGVRSGDDDLDSAAGNSIIKGMNLINNDIYYLGQSATLGWLFCFWKNNELNSLPLPDPAVTAGITRRIIIFDGNRYITGHCRLGGGYMKAAFWENDKAILLEDYGIYESFAIGVGAKYKK